MSRTIFTIAAIAAISGCTTTDPNEGGKGLRLGLGIAPPVVARNAQFEVTYELYNPSGSTVTINPTKSCVAELHVFRDGTRQTGFPEIDGACLTVPASVAIKSQEALAHTFTAVASGPPGNYTIEVQWAIDGLRTVDADLQIQ